MFLSNDDELLTGAFDGADLLFCTFWTAAGSVCIDCESETLVVDWLQATTVKGNAAVTTPKRTRPDNR